MKPYDSILDLENRLKLLKQALLDARQIKNRLRGDENYNFNDIDEKHFFVFEEMLVHEIEAIKFQIQLEKLLTIE